MKFLIASLALLGVACAAPQNTYPDFGLLSDEEIVYINKVQNSWKAGRNFRPDSAKYVKSLLGVNIDASLKFVKSKLPEKQFLDGVADLPENFDAREKWTHCPSLKEIRNQANCGSCWAFGAVESMTDRICIQSNGTKNAHLSAEDLMTCCHLCGMGCNGGTPAIAWIHYAIEGIVTGGQYNSSQGCQPYKIPACGAGMKDCPHSTAQTPRCEKKCEAGYNVTYKDDKHYGHLPYWVLGEKRIMEELYTKGPVEAAFTVYADFMQYKSGVYKHTSGAEEGGHAVKIIGYGVDNGAKYWLVANSWDSNWGDAGYFKILRGVDECGIESQVVAGEPKL